MKISVVMATYNGEKFIKEQLDSIRLQTIIPEEVIICDDCSTDTTVALVKTYIEKYSLQNSWKLWINEKNLGFADNFHKAIGMASGDYIFFSDQDDIWKKKKIEIMIEIMDQRSDCQLLCTDYELFTSQKDILLPSYNVIKKMSDNGTLDKVQFDKKSIYIGALGCCMCVRRGFYKSVSSYWFDGWAQDDRMWRLAQCVNGCYLLHSNLVRHRLHERNTATYGKYHTSEKRLKLFRNMQKANEQMIRMLSDNNQRARYQNIMRKHAHMMNLRVELLEKHKVLNSLFLLKYINYYQKKQSLLLEGYMALARK